MMERINEAVSWYQHKISTYDKQLWERSVEKKVLKSIHSVPKKTVKDKPELIDVDLVRGSTFPKAKPRHGWLFVSRQGISRIILLPVYFTWWRLQTNTWFAIVLVVFYCLQVGTLFVYFQDPNNRLSAESISAAHVVTPMIMMFLLGLMHSHIIATQEANRPHRKPKVTNKSHGKKSKNKNKSNTSGQSEHDSRSHDTVCGKKLAEDVTMVTGLRQRKLSSKTVLNRRRSGSVILNGTIHGGRSKMDRSDEADDETDEEVMLPKVTVQKVTASKVKTDAPSHKVCAELEKLSQNTQANTGKKNCKSLFQKLSLPKDGPSIHKDLNGQVCDRCVECDLSHAREGNGLINEEELGDGLAPFSLDAEYLSEGFMEVTGELLTAASSENLHAMEETDTYDQNPELLCPIDGVDYLSNCDVIGEIDKDSGVLTRNDTDTNSESSRNVLEGAAYEKLNDPSIVKPCGCIVDDTDLINVQCCDIDSMPDISKNKTKVSVKATSAGQSKESDKKSVLHRSLLLNLRQNKKDHLGVSSCDSEADATPVTPKLLGSEVEWEDHSDMTSCSDTSSNTASDSQLSDNDLLGSSSDKHKEKIPHIASVMNNLASGSDKVSCMIWEDDEIKKIDLTVLDIGWSIIRKVDTIPETCDYLVLGLIFSVLVSIMPAAFRLYWSMDKLDTINSLSETGEQIQQAHRLVFGHHWSESVVLINGMFQRCLLGGILFFLFSVAERTFKQRLLYAKHFCYLTSSRRAKKYDMPHFRLNKVRNIRTWFSLRSYLKKRGPQRSVDTIVSVAFVLEVILISVMCFQLLQDSESFLEHLGNWELIIWCMALAIYLLRFMTLGTKINKKYRNFSVLITEQINLYLQMEQKPHKKNELMMANSVLKLAEALLKELEIPFKISGLSANPFLYNITKVILLSAFSAVLTELLGFKLKLYKIKLRA